MELGIFSRTYQRSNLDEVLSAVSADGFQAIQLNLLSAGLPSMPDHLDHEDARSISQRCRAHGIAIRSLSGTFNMIHPDRSVRLDGLNHLKVLAAAAGDLGVDLISVCTGTRNPENMWHAHPDNNTPEAWSDLLETMSTAHTIAGEFGLYLGVEPEPGNVVSNATKAKQLIETLGTDRIKVIYDPANLFEDPGEVSQTLIAAVDLLAPWIGMVHGKDRRADGAVAAPGQGIVPWPKLFRKLIASGFDGPVIMHGFDEAEAKATHDFVKGSIDEAIADHAARKS